MCSRRIETSRKLLENFPKRKYFITFSGVGLSDHSLADRARLQLVIQTKSVNVRMGANSLNFGEILRLGKTGSSCKTRLF